MPGFPFLATMERGVESFGKKRHQYVQILEGEAELGVFSELQVSFWWVQRGRGRHQAWNGCLRKWAFILEVMGAMGSLDKRREVI